MEAVQIVGLKWAGRHNGQLAKSTQKQSQWRAQILKRSKIKGRSPK